MAATLALAIEYAAAGGTAPTVSGWVRGTLLVEAADDWLMAHASDPFQDHGDAEYSPDFTVAGSKLKTLVVYNDPNADSPGDVTVARAASNGLPIFAAAGDAITLPPGGFLIWHNPDGTAALTTTSNDALTVTPEASTDPELEVFAIYGP